MSSKPANDYQCAVCGRRECIHKHNDRQPQAADLATAGCKICHGTGVTKVPHPVYDMKVPGRNAKCPCGSGKKYKKCCYAGVVEEVNKVGSKACKCVLDGYGKKIVEVVKLPCSICGTEGYCDHRPSLDTVIKNALKNVKKEELRHATSTGKNTH